MRCVGFDSILRRDETDHMPSKQVMRDDIEMSHHTTPRSSIASKWKKDGYGLLAELMSNVPELSILRSFNELHLLNLFRIQAELQELESDLETIHEIDGAATQEEIRNFVRNFALMRESKEEDSRQYNKLIEISAKLEEYDSTLIRYVQVREAPHPSSQHLDLLRGWLERPAPEGDSFLQVLESTIWSENDDDFLTLAGRDEERDEVTNWIESLIRLYHKGRSFKTNTLSPYIQRYSDDKVAKTSRYITILVSSLLPTLIILILYFVKRLVVRLILVVVFTSTFSISLALFTTARKVDIFAATSAFAAVEVVFVGSTSQNGTS